MIRQFTQALALLCATSMPLAANTIVLRADPWCPYNCEPGSERPGYLVEVTAEAMAMFGHKVVYETVSWSRGLQQAADGEINGVIGAVPDEAVGFIFGPPLGRYSESLVFRAGEARRIDAPSDLRGLRIGAITGYEHSATVMAYINEHRNDRSVVQFASGDEALRTNLQKLTAGRIDVVAESRAVIDYMIDAMGIGAEVEVLDDPEVGDIFVAFSPARQVSTLYADQLTRGVAQLKATGRYAEILARYGLR